MARVLAVLMSMVVVVCGGCGNSNESAVIAQYQRGEDAIAQQNAQAFLDTMTPETVQRLEEAVVLALRASEEDTKAMGPSKMGLVLALRNRVPLARLRMMDPVDVIAWQIGEELLIVDKEYSIVPMQVVVKGNSAEMQMGEKVQRSSRARFGRRGLGLASGVIGGALGGGKVEKIDGLVHHFRRIGETWYADFVADEAEYDRSFIKAANKERVPVYKAVAMEEEESFGSINQGIWSPPTE